MVVHHILRGPGHGVIQVFDLIPGADIQLPYALQGIRPGFLGGIGGIAGGDIQGIDRDYNIVLRKPDRHGQKQDENTQEQGKYTGRELIAVPDDTVHADIHADIALTDALAVVYRLVNRQQPADTVRCDDGFDLLPASRSGSFSLKSSSNSTISPGFPPGVSGVSASKTT